MKKILLALAMFAMFASSAFAQNVNFGANISYQSEAMVGDHTDWFADDNASSGYAVGLNVRVPFSQLLSLRTGLDFQVNVYNYTEKVVTKEYDQSNLFLALQLPLLARINFTRGFFMEAGLSSISLYSAIAFRVASCSLIRASSSSPISFAPA